MTPEFKAKLQALLASYRSWVAEREVSSCRLVHYCGVQLAGAADVPLTEVEGQITGCLAEAFTVAWAQKGTCVYLAVQEPDGPQPPWDKVFAEAPLADVGAILRKLGFADGA